MRITLITVLIGSYIGNLLYHYLENESCKDDIENTSDVFNEGLELGLNHNKTKKKYKS